MPAISSTALVALRARRTIRESGSPNRRDIGSGIASTISALGHPCRRAGPLESRVLDLQPVPAAPARIGAAEALRDNPLQAHLARLGEYERALGFDGFAEHDAVLAGD